MPSKSKAQHNLMAMVANDPKAAKRLGIPQSVGRDYVKADKGRKFGSGGSMKESKMMMKKEVSFMKKKGAPKSMIKHEEAEMEGKKMRKFAAGGPSYYEKTRDKYRSDFDTQRAEMRKQRDAVKAPSEKVQALRAATDAKVAARRQAADAAYAARKAPPTSPAPRPAAPAPRPAAPSGGAAAPAGGMGAAGGTQAMMRKGGMAGSYRKAADGVAHKGKTKAHMVKMREGGSVFRKAADGIASKGKTKGKMVKMAYGGKC